MSLIDYVVAILIVVGSLVIMIPLAILLTPFVLHLFMVLEKATVLRELYTETRKAILHELWDHPGMDPLTLSSRVRTRLTQANASHMYDYDKVYDEVLDKLIQKGLVQRSRPSRLAGLFLSEAETRRMAMKQDSDEEAAVRRLKLVYSACKHREEQELAETDRMLENTTVEELGEMIKEASRRLETTQQG